MTLSYPSNYFDDEYQADYQEEVRQLEKAGYIHEDELPKINYIEECLISLMTAVYTTGDISDIEFFLEEALNEFGVKPPSTAPAIQTKIKEVESSSIPEIKKNFLSTMRDYAEEVKF